MDELLEARKIWPVARLVKARKDHLCDYSKEHHVILANTYYIDPGEMNPDRAGGFGCYRYCLDCIRKIQKEA